MFDFISDQCEMNEMVIWLTAESVCLLTPTANLL